MIIGHTLLQNNKGFDQLMSEKNYLPFQKVGKVPKLKKLGVVSAGMENTPIVFKKRLIRVQSVHSWNLENTSGVDCIVIKDSENNKNISPMFAYNCYFASAFCEKNTLFVFASTGIDSQPLTMYTSNNESEWHDPRGGHTIKMFWSKNLSEWQEKDILTIPDWRLWNTSVCKAENNYYMAIEVRCNGNCTDEYVGIPFTSFFAKSNNLFDWELLPKEYSYTNKRYNACPTLRYYNGYFYLICLEELPLLRYAPYIYRSKNFIDWEIGFHNPMLMWNDDDRKIQNNIIIDEKTKYNAKNYLISSLSDVDLCEYNGNTHIYYAIGDQLLWCALCEAVYEGPVSEYLESHFK